MKKTQTKLFAVIGGSAFVALGALGLAIGEQPTSASITSSEMSTGITVTESAAPTAPETSMAAPAIKGPAPLPPEEQGLPG